MKTADSIPDFPPADAGADSHYGSGDFMTEDLRRTNDPVPDFFHIRSADAASRHTDEHLTFGDFRDGDVFRRYLPRTAIHTRAHRLRERIVYTIGNGADGNCGHAIPAGFSHEMKTLHLDGIGGRAKPQFLRGRCHDNIGCEKRIDRRSSALNGKFHKRVVAHHDLICVVAFNGLRHQHGSDRVLSFQTPCQTGHDKDVRTFFEQLAHRSKVSPAYSREHDVNSGTPAVRRVHACGGITYAFKISQSSPRSELGTNCKTDDCPPLSHWERPARQLNRSWRAG